MALGCWWPDPTKLVGLCRGKPCCLCFPVGFSLFFLGAACGGMLLGFRAPSGIFFFFFFFNFHLISLYLNGEDPFP